MDGFKGFKLMEMSVATASRSTFLDGYFRVFFFPL